MKLLSFSLLLSIFSLSSFLSSSEDHEYYFSVMTMEKNTEHNTLDVEYRIFSDDLETAIGSTEDAPVRLGDEREAEDADKRIFDYLFDHVTFKGEGWENADVIYLGKEVKNDINYVYIEYTGITSWENVEITNTILFEHFAGQINQLTYVNGSEIKTESTVKEYPNRTINFGE